MATMREGLHLLVARVEKADGVSFLLNGDIAEVLGMVPTHRTMKRGAHEASDRWLAGGLIHYQAPNFTGSIDAAASLVPEGYTWCSPGVSRPNWDARIVRTEDGMVSLPLTKPCVTLSLALTAAALRARAAMEPSHD